MAVAPGGLFYRLAVGGQQVGYSSTTIDTLPDADTRRERLRARRAGAGHASIRTAARSTTMLSRRATPPKPSKRLLTAISAVFCHTAVCWVIRVVDLDRLEGDSQMTRIPLQGPITLPTLLPARLAFAASCARDARIPARLFDPLLLTGRDVSARVAAESTLVVADALTSIDHDDLGSEHFDTVRAFRIGP